MFSTQSAYEWRIGEWSSCVASSDLFFHEPLKTDLEAFLASSQAMVNGEVVLETRGGRVDAVAVASPPLLNASGATYAQSADWGVEEAEGFIKLFGVSKIGRAEGRERVCQAVEITGVAVVVTKKKIKK